MTNDAFLRNLLLQQDLTDKEYEVLHNLRDKIQALLSKLEGAPRFYYAGSYAKKTIIREKYDLDIVVYWPRISQFSLKGIYDGVGTQLKKEWQYVNSKTVSWEIPFQDGLHIDVVPGRALDDAFKEANLYRTDTGTTLKTSIKIHIDTVRISGRSEAIRLVKLWRVRKKVPFKKTFLLEMMTIQGSKGVNDLSGQVWSAFQYIRDNIETGQVKDPANSNNSLSDDISKSDKSQIKNIAQWTLSLGTWNEIFS